MLSLRLFGDSAHQTICIGKQKERQAQIDNLSPLYSQPLSSPEEELHALSISQLVAKCHEGHISPSEIMLAYGKKAVQAHQATNCITDFMFDQALLIPAVANWSQGADADSASSNSSDSSRDRPSLLGVPVGIKDTVNIAGHDSTIGFSANAFHPSSSSSSIVRLLQDAGALIHAKTAVPAGLFGIETSSDLWGRTSNPYNPAYTCGASSGGGAALLASGGSKIEIGSDIGGSVRIPAHFCGLWSVKSSVGRFPSWGNTTSLPGLESVPIITAPMAGTLEDLEEFWKRVILAKPWLYDHTCIPLPWQPVNLREEGRRLKWGIMWDDGVIPPTPACKRALAMVVSSLRQQGHEVVDFTPPDTLNLLRIGYELLFSECGDQIRENLSPSEKLGAPVAALMDLLSLPRWLKRVLSYLTARSGDPLTATLINVMHRKSVREERALVFEREKQKATWHDKWTEQGLDFVLTVPVALPAFEHGASEKTTLMCAAYNLIFNLLDYTTGVMPITHVDKDKDALPTEFTSTPEYKSMQPVAKGAYSVYDADKMHGLPVGVQIVGRRLEEEKVLEGMKVIEEALNVQGIKFNRKKL
ncbi:amidase signature domain-containing protein [Cyathus striatus]|nr:amidase signature domain-containing protein [Cyathus striatus]